MGGAWPKLDERLCSWFSLGDVKVKMIEASPMPKSSNPAKMVFMCRVSERVISPAVVMREPMRPVQNRSRLLSFGCDVVMICPPLMVSIWSMYLVKSSLIEVINFFV